MVIETNPLLDGKGYPAMKDRALLIAHRTATEERYRLSEFIVRARRDGVDVGEAMYLLEHMQWKLTQISRDIKHGLEGSAISKLA